MWWSLNADDLIEWGSVYWIDNVNDFCGWTRLSESWLNEDMSDKAMKETDNYVTYDSMLTGAEDIHQ